MGEILGIGTTHYPPGLVPEEHKPWRPLQRLVEKTRMAPHRKSRMKGESHGGHG